MTGRRVGVSAVRPDHEPCRCHRSLFGWARVGPTAYTWTAPHGQDRRTRVKLLTWLVGSSARRRHSTGASHSTHKSKGKERPPRVPISTMKSTLSAALLVAVASAFTPQNLAFVPGGRFQSEKKVSPAAPQGRSLSLGTLHASKSRDKIASRTKWAEERGYGSSDESTSSGGGPKLIIAGAPASGKGTQCEIIKDKYGVVHLSTGDMLRAAVAAGTEVGKQAKDFMDSGKLVPDEVIIGVVKDRLDESDCVEKGWLLDGFPRTPAQAQALADAGVSADCFIFLNVPDDVLVERVVGRRTDPETGKIYHMTFSPPDDEEVLARLEQRSDDTEEKVKVRLEQFHANVEAVKGSYTDISVEVDGTQKPDEVCAVIMESIDKALA
ncbi:hypothetical protein THAOC_16668 [Thalassiosira oceanica]|uniref:Adenylate kinase active site lid domain-containing protein n=1 Tax=Thalassiosira oceanica TaxID=159749 RepID=K0S9C9_THAOC|nr:hypothetical protein THAOC_16668 [Thalassiosira oceanica]|eukprot:EJK62708.1 hypothetical protein THAOC_16668 [Thalassiosira oceanica]